MHWHERDRKSSRKSDPPLVFAAGGGAPPLVSQPQAKLVERMNEAYTWIGKLANPVSESGMKRKNNAMSCLWVLSLLFLTQQPPYKTHNPDAEVVSLSPRTLLESDRYVCEICNQGFQRDQNLQMHRRRHKVPWKLLRREAAEVRKRVFVCPEPTCLHHDPCHALGDLVGIKKHFRRKHSSHRQWVRKRVFVCPEPTCLHHDPCHALGDLVGIKKHFRRKHSSHRQWVCARCSKAYAVQSDYKAHLKTCGTRGHSCDCGRVFSSSSPSSNTNTGPTLWPGLRTPTPAAVFIRRPDQPPSSKPDRYRTQGVELQLLPPSSDPQTTLPSPAMHPIAEEVKITKLQLSVGPAADHPPSNDPQRAAARLKDETMEQIKLAMAEKALADEARRQARRQHELAEQEFENAKRIRRQAQLELDRAHAIRERAVQQVDSTTALQITCYACKQQLRANPAMASEDNSFVVSYMSSVVTEGEEEHDDRKHRDKISKS
ncbi:hypothetical protein C4D60_Mb03t21050 [Musa balbisiana]|uniref:C2H2-type domain-containing protein n=1 Tax=Musa balbisiana TaxID=52838 RepID=A0A4S8JD79_MUSBA|nr:hypothetical protein C4D60_Mb03t21050 [Musa balbisiana]